MSEQSPAKHGPKKTEERKEAASFVDSLAHLMKTRFGNMTEAQIKEEQFYSRGG